MRYFILSVFASLALVWGAVTVAGAAGEDRGRAAAAAELDAAAPVLLAQADDVPHVGPAAAMLFDAGPDQGAATLAPVALAAAEPTPPKAPPPAVTSESTPEEVAAAAWWALRAGYVGPAALLLMFAAGAAAMKRRGYIVKRWPRLNDGRAWAAVSIVTVAAGTLIPLALANDLTAKALYAAALGSLLLWVKSQLGQVATPAPAAG